MMMIKRLRRRLAYWLMPELFHAAHDVCNNAVPYCSGDDDYYIQIVNEQAYIDAWKIAMPIVIDFDNGWADWEGQ